jgi:SAM-dependent methyltransferase
MPASPASGVEDTPSSTAAADGGARCQWCLEPFPPAAKRLSNRVLCPRCGAASTDPQPSDAELDHAYAGWYRPGSGRFAGPLDAFLRRSRGSLAGRVDEIAPEGQVLDVGAGDGPLLDALRERGRDALGIERDSTRADVREAELSELDGHYAGIVFWHSLEHLREAGGQLARAAELLAPGGVLVVAMPNAGSLQASLLGERWLALDIPRHLVHVPGRALLDRLRDLGLRVERVSQLRGGQAVFGWLHGLVGLLPGRPDLYDAIRRSEARRRPLPASQRVLALAAGAVLLPFAAALTLLEAVMGRGGSVYAEARRV